MITYRQLFNIFVKTINYLPRNVQECAKNEEKCIFLKKSCKNVWWIQKSVLPLQCHSKVVH